MATILYGNGLNRLNPMAPSWGQILTQIESSFIPPPNSQMQIPATIQYDKIELHSSRHSSDLIKDLCDKIKGPWDNSIYKRMSRFTNVNFLTTNYDHTLEACFPIKYRSKKRETTYNIFSYSPRYDDSGETENLFGRGNIWHIHGDIDRPKSIILGYEHYCKEIAEMRKYIPYSIRNLLQTVKSVNEGKIIFPQKSWIDLFFTDNIFIIGLGLDFAELDLWWLIDMWSRLKKKGYVTNTIYYLDAIQLDQRDDRRISFIDTLQSFKIEYIPYEASTYDEAYQKCMDYIEKRI